MFHEYHKDGFTISTDPDLLDIDSIHYERPWYIRHSPETEQGYVLT